MKKNYQVVFTEKCKAEVLETDMPVISDDQVLIESEVSQISTGTELAMLEANVDKDSLWYQSIRFPEYPGYSNVGTIIQTGKNVDPSLLGKRMLSQKAHIKYAVAEKSDLLIPIPDCIPSDEAVFGVLGQVALGSIRAGGVVLGETVVVFGAGLVGQLVATLSKIAGAIKIFVVDLSDLRLSLIPDDPCFIKINPKKEDVIENIKHKNKGELATLVFETTGAAHLFNQEMKCIKRGANGRFVITSSPKTKSLFDFDYCSRYAIKIIGAHNNYVHTDIATRKDPWTVGRDSEYYLELLEKNQISIKHLITHRECFLNAPKMYEMLMKDRTMAMAVHLYWKE